MQQKTRRREIYLDVRSRAHEWGVFVLLIASSLHRAQLPLRGLPVPSKLGPPMRRDTQHTGLVALASSMLRFFSVSLSSLSLCYVTAKVPGDDGGLHSLRFLEGKSDKKNLIRIE